MKKFKAFQLLLTLSLAGVLTSCNSEIINLPSDKDDPIVDVSNDSSNQVNTNDKETVYDNIEGSIDRNQEQLNTILTDLADSKYLKDEFAITQEEIDEKVHEKFMDVANESTYNDTYSRFQEYNYALSLVQQGYQIKTSEGKTDLASLQQASNLVLVTPESEYEDVFKLDYSDYVTRNLVPEIKRQYLTARYLYENSYSSIGTTAARNITFVKIQDRDDKPGEASKLVSHFVSLLKDPSVSSEDADLRNLSKLWKGNYTSEETIQGKTYDKILKEWNVSNLNDQLNDQLKKIIEVDTDGSLKKDDNLRLEAIEELKQLLHLDHVSRMESFDNSHLFGTFYVGGMVVFEDFLPLKNEYRKFKISTDVKDDLSAMKEVLYRRYFKVLMDNLQKPDLIVMDGGKLQISVAKEIIDSLGLHIPIIGLVKDDNHRTSYIMNDKYEILDVPKDSNLFLFFTRIQDEVHRYAITYHRNIKAKGLLSSVLDVVPGIGEVRKKELLKRFGSLKKLKEASVEELSEVVNKDVAETLANYLKDM